MSQSRGSFPLSFKRIRLSPPTELPPPSLVPLQPPRRIEAPVNPQHALLLNLQDLLDLEEAGEPVVWPQGLSSSSAREMIQHGSLPPSIVYTTGGGNSASSSSSAPLRMLTDLPDATPQGSSSHGVPMAVSPLPARELPVPCPSSRVTTSLDDPDFPVLEEEDGDLF